MVIWATHRGAESADEVEPLGPRVAPDHVDTAGAASAYVLDHGRRAPEVLEADVRDALAP